MPEKEPKLEEKVSFKDTLNLPHTDFPIRSNSKVDDPAMLERWQKEDIYNKTFIAHKGNEKFILHDGPPYANGHLHLGHAYNNILKDISTKSQRMMGKEVPVTPGWDCHGLPIELKVTQEHPGLDSKQLRKKCREYAQGWIDVQREERKRLGVFMDWDHPYTTMSFEYESAIMRAFGVFVAEGYIEYKNKTVPWCPSDQTVLAAAEIEYQDRKDPSIYFMFPLQEADVKKVFPQLAGQQISFLLWTTTPWSVPLNRAVLVRPETTYAVVRLKNHLVIIGKALVEKVADTMKEPAEVLAEIPSAKLAGLKVHHPFVKNLLVPVIADNSVSLEDGTACVSNAPGCGPEDYEIGVRNGLEIFSPLSPDGKYTTGIEPKELEGMPINDGTIWVLRRLLADEKLLHKETIKHPYPHCWRCRNPLMFRATKQWFCDLEKHDLRNKALKAIDGINMIPAASSNRFKATLEGRLEWCLSRQRVWGVPIPALLCTGCEKPYITQEFANKIAQGVAKRGIEYWDEVQLDEISAGVICTHCKGTKFKKETDILDVWFESGVSHYAVLLNWPELRFPADMYLEGKDQHRAWFQSSLLTGMVLEKLAPMRIIMTHGFTVDEHGKKMSKSIGNVVVPQQMIDKLGTDGLRLWASSIDCQGEAVVSEQLLQNVSEVYRKIRNTCRFLLSNLYDFDIQKNAMPLAKLNALDQYALEQLFKLNHSVLRSYNDFDFTSVFHQLAEYCASDLSSFYLDIVKDRLYVEEADGHPRRSAQTVSWYILDTLTRLMAPVMSFAAEQLSDYYQKDKKESIHLQKFSALPDVWELLGHYYADLKTKWITAGYTRVDVQPLIETEAHLFASERDMQWQLVKDVRSAMLKAIELKREQGLIKHSLEARLSIYLDLKSPKLNNLQSFFDDMVKAGQSVESFFKELLIVSQVELAPKSTGLDATELPELYITVEHARGDKCPRCWQWDVTTNEYKLCNRCQKVLGYK